LYEFTDGTAYVGRSIDMAKRLAEHRHDYKHIPELVGKRIRRALFAPVGDGIDEATLDEIETQSIHWAEDNGFDLINKLKTDKPGGTADFSITLETGATPLLPWSRTRRTNDLERAHLEKASESQKRRYQRLRATPFSSTVIDSLSYYVAETIPEYACLAGTRWSLTAYPHRSQSPGPEFKCVACLTCGTLETFVIWTDSISIFGFINCKRPEDDNLPKPLHPARPSHTTYRAADNIVQYTFRDERTLRRLLNDKRVLNWCYRLNVEMMRKGTNPQARWTNPQLTKDVIIKADCLRVSATEKSCNPAKDKT
ncbi:MAG: GIY-YIG nuclease family protein, partial [Atopobiaceae bacterium]